MGNYLLFLPEKDETSIELQSLEIKKLDNAGECLCISDRPNKLNWGWAAGTAYWSIWYNILR